MSALILQFLKNIVLLLGFCLGPKAVAEVIDAGHLRIELDVKASRALPKGKKQDKYRKHWKAGCERLGAALLAGKGPFGFGAFASFSCFRGSDWVSGDKKDSAWLVTVVDGKTEAKFVLRHKDNRGNSVVAEYSMPSSEFTLEFFADDEFADTVAFALLEDAPMGRLLTKSDLFGSPPQFKGRYWRAGKSKDFKFTVPKSPEFLVIYSLKWSEAEQRWRSDVVGSAKRVNVIPPKKEKRKKGSILVGGEVVYETTPAVAAALETGNLWAQVSTGPGSQHKATAEQLKQAQIALAAAAQSGKLGDFLVGKFDLLSSLLSSTASGYVGLRYGRQVLPGVGGLGTLLNKTSIFGLLVEIRGGPAKGLRYYYDLLPKAKATVPGSGGPVDTSIQFSRHTLGYSFDFDPHLLVDRVTIDPKVGVWTFNAKLPTEIDGDGLVSNTANFKLGTTVSLGLEVGLEELSDWYTIRGWYGINSGFSLLKTGGKVTSNQFGIDAYFTAGPTIPFFGVPLKTALMAFYFFESVNLSANKPVGELAPGDSNISGVSYTVGYAGIGAVLSW